MGNFLEGLHVSNAGKFEAMPQVYLRFISGTPLPPPGQDVFVVFGLFVLHPVMTSHLRVVGRAVLADGHEAPSPGFADAEILPRWWEGL